MVDLELRGETAADVGDGGEGGDDQRNWGGDAFFAIPVGPNGAHAHGILADGNGDSEGGAEFHADGFDGGVEVGGIAGHGRGSHPIGGEVDLTEVADLGGGEIGEGFADGESGGSGGVVDGDGSAFAHGHGFTGVDVEGGGGDAAIGDGHLPGTDHLIAHDQAANGAVADRDEKGFVRHGGVHEHAFAGFAQVEAFEKEFLLRTGPGDFAAVHARRFAEEHLEGHVDRSVVEMRIGDGEVFFLGGLADDGVGRAFAVAEFGKGAQVRPPSRSAPAIRCTRSRAGTCRAHRWGVCAGRICRRVRRR